VLVTAQHAALLGYRTTILEDGVWSVDASLGQAALEIFRRAFGDTCDLEALQFTT
jgi:nicotinamidase-related amidase